MGTAYAAPSATQAEPPIAEPQTGEPEAAVLVVVGPRDTLMSIAREWADAKGVTVAQSMYGIYRSNRHAFGPGGMNELRRGATLRLPETAKMRAVPRREAVEAVSRELGIWSGAQTPSAAFAAPSPADAAPAEPGAEPPANPAADAAASSAVTSPELTVDERLARLETELLARQRELEAKLAAIENRPANQSANDTATFAALLDRWGLWWALAAGAGALVATLLASLWLRARAPRRDDEAPSSTPSPVPAPAPAPAPVHVSPPQEPTPPSLPKIVVPKAIAQDDLQDDGLEGDPPPLQDVVSMLDLARAYLEMGEKEAAARELRVVLELGDETQRSEAERLLATC